MGYAHRFAAAIVAVVMGTTAAIAGPVTKGADLHIKGLPTQTALILENHDGDMDARRAEVLEIARTVNPEGISLTLIDAVITRESRYRADARGGSGEVGLMQIMPATARELAIRMGIPNIERMSDEAFIRYLFKPRNNLRLGIAYLDWCRERADGDIAFTIGCYNAGPSKMRRWQRIEITRNYVHFVKDHLELALYSQI